MSDPLRLTDARSGAPPQLAALVRDLDAPPPLPPAIQLEVRGRLRARRPRVPYRWIAPGVVAAAAAIAGLVLWTFRPTPSPSAEMLDTASQTPSVETPTLPDAVPDAVPGPETAPEPEALPAGGPQAEQTATLQVAIHGGFGDVYVDGRAVGPSPQDVRVPPGRHAVRVRFANGEEVRRFVDAPSGSTQVFFDAPGPQVAQAPRSGRSDRRRRPTAAPAPAPVGPRSPADIRRVITANRASVQPCGQGVAETTRVSARIRIATDGSVESVQATGDPNVGPCVERAVRGWRFGPGDTTTVSFPFVFQPVQASGRSGSSSRPSRGPPTPTGELVINTSPWARVFLDGRAVGNTPVILRDVPAGRHHVRLRTADGRVTQMTVDVRAGERTRVVRRLDTQSSGALRDNPF